MNSSYIFILISMPSKGKQRDGNSFYKDQSSTLKMSKTAKYREPFVKKTISKTAINSPPPCPYQKSPLFPLISSCLSTLWSENFKIFILMTYSVFLLRLKLYMALLNISPTLHLSNCPQGSSQDIYSWYQCLP